MAANCRKVCRQAAVATDIESMAVAICNSEDNSMNGVQIDSKMRIVCLDRIRSSFVRLGLEARRLTGRTSK